MATLLQKGLQRAASLPKGSSERRTLLAALKRQAKAPTDKEVLDYMGGSQGFKPDSITVSDLVEGFGGTSSSHTKLLQKMVQDGKLTQKGSKYSLPKGKAANYETGENDPAGDGWNPGDVQSLAWSDGEGSAMPPVRDLQGLEVDQAAFGADHHAKTARIRADKKSIHRWMLANWSDYTDSRDEVDMTALAEAAAHEADRDDWLDDSTHWVWDVAHDIHEMWEDGKLDGMRSATIRLAYEQAPGTPLRSKLLGLLKSAGRGDRRKRKHKTRRPFKPEPFESDIVNRQEKDKRRREDDEYEGAWMALEGGITYSIQIHGRAEDAVNAAVEAVVRGARGNLEAGSITRWDEGGSGGWSAALFIEAFEGPDERGLLKLVSLAKQVPGVTEVFHTPDPPSAVRDWQQAKQVVERLRVARLGSVPGDLRSLLKGEWVEVRSEPVVAIRYFRGLWGAIMRNGLINSYNNEAKFLYQLKNSMQVPHREAERAWQELRAKVGPDAPGFGD